MKRRRPYLFFFEACPIVTITTAPLASLVTDTLAPVFCRPAGHRSVLDVSGGRVGPCDQQAGHRRGCPQQQNEIELSFGPPNIVPASPVRSGRPQTPFLRQLHTTPGMALSLLAGDASRVPSFDKNLQPAGVKPSRKSEFSNSRATKLSRIRIEGSSYSPLGNLTFKLSRGKLSDKE
jgi:hypothetical protein